MPRGWLFPANTGYARERAINAFAIRPLPGAPGVLQSQLSKACTLPGALHASAAEMTKLLESSVRRSNFRVVALDVGQAACVAFMEGDTCVGYFDVGAPLFFNAASFPKTFSHNFGTGQFVFLSHWDYDHFALAYKYPLLQTMQWYAPDQPVGPNTARLQRRLGTRLKFVTGNSTTSHSTIASATGTNPKDRNSTGYVLRIEKGARKTLLTGDADYTFIPNNLRVSNSSVMIPHHGGAGSKPPAPSNNVNCVAVASYGTPNTYRHPNEPHLRVHTKAGWKVQRTATSGNPARQRGPRQLHP